jgi:hypothetical protein
MCEGLHEREVLHSVQVLRATTKGIIFIIVVVVIISLIFCFFYRFLLSHHGNEYQGQTVSLTLGT